MSRRNKKGFALFEVIITISVLAILVLLLILAINPLQIFREFGVLN